MAARIAPPPVLGTTYKLREAEGFLDLYFYRRVGFRLAQLFAKVGLTPVAVTILGGLVGIVAGHLYYYRDLTTNIVGMALHVCANVLDNADGQLARLTGRGSRNGRIVDSLVDHLIFLNIYVHLAFRCLAEGAPPAIFLLALAAGVSHAMQGAAADYYRNGYLYYVTGRTQAQFDSTASLRSTFRELEWRRKPWTKFLLAVYLNFTWQQEMLAPKLKRLREVVDRLYPQEVPEWLKARYADSAKGMFKGWGFLMTNTRMIILFVLLFLGRPIWYFWIELTVLNLLLILLLLQQNKMAESLWRLATEAGEQAQVRP
jgi:phosphatidylglycerophosphate synthase